MTHAPCTIYNHYANRKRTTVMSLWREYLDVDYKDITMVLQLTMDRINLLNVHAYHWTGPMSVTVYLERKHLPDLGSILSVMDQVLQRNNIDLHIVLKEGVRNTILILNCDGWMANSDMFGFLLTTSLFHINFRSTTFNRVFFYFVSDSFN